MPIGQREMIVVDADLNGPVLLAAAGLCFLDISEVRPEIQRELEAQWTPRSIDDRERDAELCDANPIREANVQRPLRNSVRVRTLLVAGLPGTASARLGDLRMDKRQRQRGRINRRRVTEPGPLAIDLEGEPPEEPRLAEIKARQRLVVSALASRVDDQE